MTDPRFQRLIDIVGEARLRSADDRESFLVPACEGDETLTPRRARAHRPGSDPPRPSRNSVRAGDIDGEASRGGGETGSAPRPCRDLDWVVMKTI